MLNSQEQIFEQIKKAQNILIAFPARWNGDSLGSALALFLFLKKIGKKVDIASSKEEGGLTSGSKTKAFSFLPAFNEIKRTIRDLNKFVVCLNTSKTKLQGVKYRVDQDSLKFIISAKKGSFSAEDIKIEASEAKYDLIITVDSPDLESLGDLFAENTQFFYETAIINIDHHGANEEYGSINLVQINAVSTSEILFSILSAWPEKHINADIATCLLTGIISKTKNFKTANLTPDALAATSSLISHEARREEIINKLYRSRNIGALKLWGIILSRLTGLHGNQVVWSIVTANDFLKSGADKNDLNDIMDELMANIPEAKLLIIFYELVNSDGTENSNFLIHSPKNINLMDFMKDHNPHGDEKLVEVETKKKMEELKNEIIALINNKIGQYNF